MKRKVVNPDIQQKKLQQTLEEETSSTSKKIPKEKPKKGHK
ncbi:MAG: hypothetical protein P0S93_06425 [Candidatus Neptunochlamydia sp.]|nr:hypothetical protein [Candidatus Neptunochlamydia sp.]